MLLPIIWLLTDQLIWACLVIHHPSAHESWFLCWLQTQLAVPKKRQTQEEETKLLGYHELILGFNFLICRRKQKCRKPGCKYGNSQPLSNVQWPFNQTRPCIVTQEDFLVCCSRHCVTCKSFWESSSGLGRPLHNQKSKSFHSLKWVKWFWNDQESDR